MELINSLQQSVCNSLSDLYHVQIEKELVKLEETPEDYEGDLTIPVFPFAKYSKKSPAETAQQIGEYLIKNTSIVGKYSVIKGFLNLEIKKSFWIGYLNEMVELGQFTPLITGNPKTILVEYSSPNTNKPLHLGHIRNNLIGYSISQILKVLGHHVVMLNLMNDRGIHICKSMIAWKKFGNNETPESTHTKGDHFVGDFYVLFENKYKEQVNDLVKQGIPEPEALKKAPLVLEAQQLLKSWEENQPDVRDLWHKLNGWVYEGFNETYQRMGVCFDKIYYESETYLLGKKMVLEGLKSGIFYKKEDGSVWGEFSNEGLDEKLLLRADGTSVYITQDLGTAQLKYDDYQPDLSLYVVGNEQDYHFQLLPLILKKLGKPYADKLFHLSYGMVDLPQGRMKTREGNVVDADDLMDEMKTTAHEYIINSGKIEGLSQQEMNQIEENVALAALKFYILKTDAKKRMLFNPDESIDFQGHTGPFVQYTYARISSILRKLDQKGYSGVTSSIDLEPDAIEIDLLKKIYHFNDVLKKTETEMDPSLIANYIYHVAKVYNKFYHDFPVIKEPDGEIKNFRINLSVLVSQVIRISMNLLGIEVPEKM